MSESSTETIRLPYHVPYYAQVASPELAEAIFVQGMDPAQDPRWAESGAETPQEYAYWVERACGVACLKMCVEALDGPVRSLVDWAHLGLEQGGYLVRRDEDGKAHEVGWIHSALAKMAQESGLIAEAHPARLEEIPVYLRQGQMVIASVSYEAGDDRLPITKQSGHLMVVIGADCVNGRPIALYVNNPSGRRAELQASARLSFERFAAAYSGRVIVIGRAEQENKMARDTSDLFEYEVALSFAEEDSAVAEDLARRLRSKNMRVLLDEYKASEAPLWGKDPVDHLVNIYARKARYCVLFLSQHYPLRRWTKEERSSAQERAFRDATQYILPVRLDDTVMSDTNETPAYRDLRQDSMESLVDWLEGKLAEAREQSGPPTQSHDLRSGNVPSTHRKPGE